MKRSVLLFFLLYSAAGFVASLVVHFLLYAGFSLYQASSALWLLMHLCIFGGWVGLYVLRNSFQHYSPDLYTREAPKPLVLMTILFAVFLPYAIINFFYYQSVLKEGYPGVVEGRRVLVLQHGQKPRPLTEEEYARAETQQARKTSGHWMIAHLIPCMMLYMTYKFGSDEPAEASQDGRPY